MGEGVCVARRAMCGRGHAWQGGMRGRGGHAWQRGHAWQGGQAWQRGVHGREACVSGETATAADGTQPTGMRSCFECDYSLSC